MPFRIYYVITACLNFFMMLLTGCRTALLPFVFIFPIFFWADKKKWWFIASLVAESIVFVIVLFNPELVPRYDQMSALNSG